MSFWYELYRNDIPVYWTREGGNGLSWIDCHHFCFLDIHHFCFLDIHCYDIARIDMCIVAINIPDIQCTCNLYCLNSASWVFSPKVTDFYNLPDKSRCDGEILDFTPCHFLCRLSVIKIIKHYWQRLVVLIFFLVNRHINLIKIRFQ